MPRRICTALVLSAAAAPFAGTAAAQGGSAQVWAETPSAAAVMAVWPRDAARKGRHGDALARCRIRTDGRLSDCKVVIERPKGQGFGAALLSLAPAYRLAPGARGDGDDEREALISADWPVPDAPVDWRWEPKKGDFQVTYPPAARQTGRPGYGVVNCQLGAQGDLYDCQVVAERPRGVGWGFAVWRFTPFLRFKPVTYQGKRVRASVTVPMWFEAAPRSR